MGQFVGAMRAWPMACRRSTSRRVRQRLALQRDRRPGHSADPGDRRRRRDDPIDRDGLDIVLVGGFGSHLGQSAYLRDIIGKVDGPPPPVDLDAERKNGEAVRSAILQGKVAACHDISSGGLLVALAEMCLAGGVGATVSLSGDAPTHAQAFGEDQGRYLIATSDGDALAGAMIDAGLTADVIGFTGGESVTVNDVGSVALADLRQAHEGWLPGYMSL
jgi:phosphoribosylformylglycinamidine (FGAM) synthase-like enzyme